MANYQSVIDYFNQYMEHSKQSSELDHIQEQIALVRKYKSDIDKLINSKFRVQLENNDMDYFMDYYIQRIRIVKDLNNEEEKNFKMYLYILRGNYDSNNPSYQTAREKMARVQKDFSYALSELHKKERTITNVSDTDMISLLTRIMKPTSNNQYRISGNVSVDEYETILDLLNRSDISIEERIAFVRELNSAIAKFKYQKEKITGRIEIDTYVEKMEQEEISPYKQSSTKKIAGYNYDRILRARTILSQDFDGQPSTLKISEDTPYNFRERKLLYYLPNKEGIDYNTILYDLNTFINPDHLDEMFQNGKIHSKELDAIRNRIYTEIINIVNNYKKKKLVEAEEKPEEKEEIIVPEEIEEKPMITEEKPLVEIVEESIGEKLLEEYKLTDEQIQQVEEAIFIAEEYKTNFYQLYPYNSVILKSCLEMQTTEGYDFSLDMAELMTKHIPEMMKVYNDYVFYASFIRQSLEEDKDAIELFVDTRDLLLSTISKVLNLMETMPLNTMETSPEEKKEEKPIINFDHRNLVLLYQDPEKGPLLLQEDVEKAIHTGNVSAQKIAKGFETLYHLNTINPKKDTCKKIKASNSSYDDVAKEYTPRRHRQKDMRYPFINIYMCEEMKEFLMEHYHETLPQIQLKCVYMLFYTRGDKSVYTDAMKRLSEIAGDPNQVGSIEWIKNIFSEPFTEEKRNMAIQLLDNSTRFIEGLQNTIEMEDIDQIEEENIMEGEMMNAAK